MSVLQTSSIAVDSEHLNPRTNCMAARGEAPLLHASQAAPGVPGDQASQVVAFQPMNHRPGRCDCRSPSCVETQQAGRDAPLASRWSPEPRGKGVGAENLEPSRTNSDTRRPNSADATRPISSPLECQLEAIGSLGVKVSREEDERKSHTNKPHGPMVRSSTLSRCGPRYRAQGSFIQTLCTRWLDEAHCETPQAADRRCSPGKVMQAGRSGHSNMNLQVWYQTQHT